MSTNTKDFILLHTKTSQQKEVDILKKALSASKIPLQVSAIELNRRSLTALPDAWGVHISSKVEGNYVELSDGDKVEISEFIDCFTLQEFKNLKIIFISSSKSMSLGEKLEKAFADATVICMNGDIPEKDLIDFENAFFKALFEDKPVDKAFRLGRNAVSSAAVRESVLKIMSISQITTTQTVTNFSPPVVKPSPPQVAPENNTPGKIKAKIFFNSKPQEQLLPTTSFEEFSNSIFHLLLIQNGYRSYISYHDEKRAIPIESDATLQVLANKTEATLRVIAIPEREYIKWDELSLSKIPEREWLLLGRGGSGSVYKAEYKSETVAVKVNNSIQIQDEKILNNEYNILSRLRHDNIIVMFGLCIAPPPFSCIMTVLQYVDGSSLRDMIKKKNDPLSDWEKFKIAKDVAQGLSYIHGVHNMSHGDIKPDNILVNKNPLMAKISDFGTARLNNTGATTTATVSHSGAYTLHYTAPEVLGNGGKSSLESDVYSFGITLWELFAGKVPFQGIHPTMVALEILKGTKPPISDMGDADPKMKELVQKCWRTEALSRPTMSQVLNDLKTMEGNFATKSATNVFIGNASNVKLGPVSDMNVKNMYVAE